jgi:DNA-binding NarL/FixJ family response regulator
MGCPRILLADDNPKMRERVAELLCRDFEVVAFVGDGQQAVDSTLKLEPDILVLDISLPILNGIQVASHLQNSGCATKVIFLTEYADRDYVEAALSLGVLGYILKSRMARDLIPAIQVALHGQKYMSDLIMQYI